MEVIINKEHYVDSSVVQKLVNEIDFLRAKIEEYEIKLYECRCKIEYLEEKLHSK